MEIDLFRGLVTAALLALFIGLFAWTWSKRRHKTFEKASRMALDDSDKPTTKHDTEQTQ